MKKQCNIAKKVYNPLNKLVRRIIAMRKSVEVQTTLSMILIPIGFSLVIAALAFNLGDLAKTLLLIGGAVGIIGGIVSANRIYKRLRSEEEKQDTDKPLDKETANRLITAIQELTKKIEEMAKK